MLLVINLQNKLKFARAEILKLKQELVALNKITINTTQYIWSLSFLFGIFKNYQFEFEFDTHMRKTALLNYDYNIKASKNTLV